MKQFTLFLFIGLLLFSCKKDELVTISGNQAPPDTTVEIETIENYITKTYILAIGREPDSSEFAQAKSNFVANHINSATLNTFLNGVFSSNDYLPHEYEINKINLLNDVDTSEFTFWIIILDNALLDTTNQAYWQQLQAEKDRLVLMRDAFGEYVSGTISNAELQRRMCNNYLYDQINMGSANFVNYTFQNLLKRNATTSELANGISMVEGNNSILFLQSGMNKLDFLNIITNSSSYYEGQVLYLFQRYLNRSPNTIEMSEATQLYQNSNDFVAVQKSILSTYEFIGIQ